MNACWHSILTPSDRAGAIAIIHVHAESFEDPNLPVIRPGQLKRTDLWGIDDGVALGLDANGCLLMPHGGVAIVRQLSAKLEALGFPIRSISDPVSVYPEASSELEAWCLHTLSIAQSPAAVDVLLDHNERWKSLGIETRAAAHDHGQSSDVFDRLIHPPTVVAIGRANIGKSTLLNTLVGQHVAMVADIEGTTRDHVGVPVDLGGLVVRWIDTPGVDERVADGDEISIASRVLAHADLIVHCIDSGDDPGEIDPRFRGAISDASEIIRVGMRSDRAAHACDVDLKIQIGDTSSGIGNLVTQIRGRLVPLQALQSTIPWRFWASHV